MQIESGNIRNWVDSGYAKIVPEEVAFQFGNYLNGLPWLPSGTGIDWGHLPHEIVDVSVATEMQRIDWLASTLLRDDPYLVFWYGPNEPCIACLSRFAVVNIETAFWRAPGRRYLFGASMYNNSLNPHFSGFAEYDGGDILRAAC